MAMAGMREVLLYAENENKTVTVRAGNAPVTGKVLRVNPLIIDQPDEGTVTVVDFESVQSVAIQGSTGKDVVRACSPQKETKYMGTRKF